LAVTATITFWKPMSPEAFNSTLLILSEFLPGWHSKVLKTFGIFSYEALFQEVKRGETCVLICG